MSNQSQTHFHSSKGFRLRVCVLCWFSRFAATLLYDHVAWFWRCRTHARADGLLFIFAVAPSLCLSPRCGDAHVHECRDAHQALAIYVTLCPIRTELGHTTLIRATGCLSECERSGADRRHLARRFDQWQCYHVRLCLPPLMPPTRPRRPEELRIEVLAEAARRAINYGGLQVLLPYYFPLYSLYTSIGVTEREGKFSRV